MTENKENLYRLLYISQAAENLSDQSVQDILDKSRSNNSNQNLTGYLVLVRGSSDTQQQGLFAQILEGSKSKLENLFTKILGDDRHSNVELLQLKPISSRDFPSWEMGFGFLDLKKHPELQGIFNMDANILAQDAEGQNIVIDFLKTFYDEESKGNA